MNPDDTLPPVPPASGSPADDADLWPSSGPGKGFRVRLPIAIASLVVVALAGAAAGASLKHTSSTTTQAGAISNRARNFPGATGEGATGANGAARGFGQGGGVFGTVTKVDGNTVTVTQRDGSTATVVIPSTATISKTDSGTIADLKPGTSVVVRGTTANGTTTAQNVTIAPAGSTAGAVGAFGGFGGFGGRARTGAGTTPTTTN
jgi:hypothetical protein